MSDKIASILIPNYKTPEITRLSMRMLKKNTDLKRTRVIVVDNDSQDESTTYLKSLPWIELIERKPPKGESPPQAEARALDEALKKVDTPYVICAHTDTIFLDRCWLDIMLKEMTKQPDIGGVGTWKLEPAPSLLKRIGKQFEYQIRRLRYRISEDPRKMAKLKNQMQSGYYSLFGKTEYQVDSRGRDYYFLRSHCAMFRMDLIQKLGLNFSFKGETAAKGMSEKMVSEGYRLIYLPSRYFSQYVVHLNHATMIYNPELGSSDRTVARGLKNIRKVLKQIDADAILADDSLDR